jgi:hypothetical protein
LRLLVGALHKVSQAVLLLLLLSWPWRVVVCQQRVHQLHEQLLPAPTSDARLQRDTQQRAACLRICRPD